MDKKQCHQCYSELDIDVIFCPRCGTKLIQESEAQDVDMADIYQAIIRLEAQLKQANINPNILRNMGGNPMIGMQGVPVMRKKKSSFNLSSIIIVLLMILIMVSLSFIGTVLVNVHASGYTKSSGEVVNELLDIFRGDSAPATSETVKELPSEP